MAKDVPDKNGGAVGALTMGQQAEFLRFEEPSGLFTIHGFSPCDGTSSSMTTKTVPAGKTLAANCPV
jgi:hypothetical protein